jgi:hypothetical protein
VIQRQYLKNANHSASHKSFLNLFFRKSAKTTMRDIGRYSDDRTDNRQVDRIQLILVHHEKRLKGVGWSEGA